VLRFVFGNRIIAYKCLLMLFKRISPAKELARFIDCYWVVENPDPAPVQQKIIPDGFTEIIFHYAEPYRINIHKNWELQSKSLIAGQLKKHFFLENTGRSGIMGIKFKPTALTAIFGVSMDSLTDRVVPLTSLDISSLNELETLILAAGDYEQMVSFANQHLIKTTAKIPPDSSSLDKAVELIFQTNGAITVTQLTRKLFLTERQLQRLFKTFVGLPPKFYARIIRFNYIFQLLKENKLRWVDLAYETGYYDQAHFIRNFRTFTGEDPSKYVFEEQNLANFFLKKE